MLLTSMDRMSRPRVAHADMPAAARSGNLRRMSTTESHAVSTATFAAAVVARSHDVPVLVDFWAAWCGPCRALGPILEALEADYAGSFVLAKIDTEAEPSLAQEFGIRSIPAVKLFHEGRVAGQFVGALPEGQIRQFLTQHGIEPGAAFTPTGATPEARVLELRAAVAATPARASLQLMLAEALLDAELAEEARRVLEALPSSLYADARAVRARARAALLVRLHADTPPELAAAVRRVVDGDAAGGIDALLDLVRAERGEAKQPAREALVDVLGVIADEDLVRDTRRRMAAALF